MTKKVRNVDTSIVLEQNNIYGDKVCIDDIQILICKLDNTRKCGALFEINNDEKQLLQVAGDNNSYIALYYLGRICLDEDREEDGWRYIKMSVGGACPAAICYMANREYWSIFKPNRLYDTPVPHNIVDLWKMAAEAGDYEAKYMLAEYADLNNAERIHLLQDSVDAGYAPAYLAIGQRYYWGRGVSQDFVTAAKYFESAFQTAAYPMSEAIQLAIIHLEGQGVNRSISKAMEYMDASVNYQLNNVNRNPCIRGESFEQLARMYLYGQVANQNRHDCIIKSLFWYQYSYESGYWRAGLYVVCLLKELGINQQKHEDIDYIKSLICMYGNIHDNIELSNNSNNSEYENEFNDIEDEVTRRIADLDNRDNRG